MSLVTTRHADELARGIETLGLNIDESAQQRLLAYLALLAKWNKAYNLTAVRNVDEMVSRHLLDSLSIVRRAIVDDDARLVFATASHGLVKDYMRGGEYPFLPGFATVAEIAASPMTRNPP